jgi:hypothetical protein
VEATLTPGLLPTFAVDSDHRLRYAMEFDGGKPVELNAADSGEWHENVAPTWAANVLRNAARAKISLGMLTAGRHRIRLIYHDSGVAFEYLAVEFAGGAGAYPGTSGKREAVTKNA